MDVPATDRPRGVGRKAQTQTKRVAGLAEPVGASVGGVRLTGADRVTMTKAMIRCDERDSLPVDVELSASGECYDATRDRECLCREGPQDPDYLHTRGTLGGKGMNDPIVNEVRRVRDAHAAMFNYDLDAIFQNI